MYKNKFICFARLFQATAPSAARSSGTYHPVTTGSAIGASSMMHSTSSVGYITFPSMVAPGYATGNSANTIGASSMMHPASIGFIPLSSSTVAPGCATGNSANTIGASFMMHPASVGYMPLSSSTVAPGCATGKTSSSNNNASENASKLNNPGDGRDDYNTSSNNATWNASKLNNYGEGRGDCGNEKDDNMIDMNDDDGNTDDDINDHDFEPSDKAWIRNKTSKEVNKGSVFYRKITNETKKLKVYVKQLEDAKENEFRKP